MSCIRHVAFLIVLSGCASPHAPKTINGEPILNISGSTDAVDTIDRPGRPSVLMISSGSKAELGVFQAVTGQPYLTMRDSDGDGVFDHLSYFALNSIGEVAVEIEDYGMDGQADLIIDRKAGTARVFFRNAWRMVNGVGSSGPSTVDIDGEELLLENVLSEIGRGAF